MNLRKKILIGIGLALVVTFLIVALFSIISMEESYRALENREVITTVTRAESSLDNDQRNLQSVTRDYAAWNDTYLFAAGQNPGWEEVNTADDFFSKFNVYGAIVLSREGDAVLARSYDFDRGEMGELDPALIAQIRRIGIVRDIHHARDGYYTILDTPEGPVIISSHPILTNTYEGPATGSLHLVRRITTRYLEDVSQRTGETVTIVPAPEMQDILTTGVVPVSTPAGRTVFVIPENAGHIAGYTLLDDLEIPGTYYLKVTEPRTIFQSGQATIATFLVTIFGAGVFIIAFVLLFIDRVVLSRLNTIIGTVRKNTGNGSPGTPHLENGVDELARLALEIDPVFARLAESRLELQQSEERYRLLAESAQDFIYIIDKGDRISYINRFAAGSVGRAPEDLIGKPRSELFPPYESDRQASNIRTVFTTGRPLKIESNLPLPSGEKWIDTLLVPIRDRNDTITGVMGITRDITQRRKTEEALFRTNKKLNLLSSITRHDILNQLTALRTYMELSLDYTDDPALTDIINKEQAIAAVIDQQITFTRDYQQMGVTAPVWQDVSSVIRWTIQPLSTEGITVSITCPGLEVFADPMFEKVFYNLVENAIRYGGGKISTVSISSEETPDGLILIVEDNGEGIAPENKELIFERGFGKNTGFGLFLSREILGITGITITENGTPGAGARFIIRVPRGGYRFTGAGKEKTA